MRRGLVVALGLIAGALGAGALGACSSSSRSPDPGPLHLAWQGIGLPAPAGGRALVRAATWCAGHWVVAGATEDPSGRTRPAVWMSADARHWQSLTLHPGADYYTAREILSTVACSHGRLAALGSMSGGAHGMPRTASWQQQPDGSLTAVSAPFGLFAGSETIGVAGMAGAPSGYLVVGTRTNGAAVWQSPNGARFRLYDGAPDLATTSRVQTQGEAAVSYRDRWLVSGQATGSSGRLRGVVWAGDRDGPWTRTLLPGGWTVSTADRLALASVGPVAAGLLDEGFGLWVLRHGSWTLSEHFGASAPGSTAASYVSGLAAPGGMVAATYSDGADFRLWAVGEDVPMPTVVTVNGDRTATLAAHGFRLLLLTDDGTTGRAWLTTVPRPAA